MTDDKIAEIRERYAGYSLNSGNAGKANEDRGWLLAEVDRQRAEIERLRKALQDIADDCEDDYPPSHGAIKYAVQDALRGNP